MVYQKFTTEKNYIKQNARSSLSLWRYFEVYNNSFIHKMGQTKPSPLLHVHDFHLILYTIVVGNTDKLFKYFLLSYRVKCLVLPNIRKHLCCSRIFIWIVTLLYKFYMWIYFCLCLCQVNSVKTNNHYLRTETHSLLYNHYYSYDSKTKSKITFQFPRSTNLHINLIYKTRTAQRRNFHSCWHSVVPWGEKWINNNLPTTCDRFCYISTNRMFRKRAAMDM